MSTLFRYIVWFRPILLPVSRLILPYFLLSKRPLDVFSLQVEPILEVLVGKTLELSVLELMEASGFVFVLPVVNCRALLLNFFGASGGCWVSLPYDAEQARVMVRCLNDKIFSVLRRVSRASIDHLRCLCGSHKNDMV